MSVKAGARLGPYEILDPLGAGGMGEVYRARDTRLDRLVAIKVLSRQLSADPELRQRFELEARAISSLNHPHICALYDVGDTAAPEPILFLVMELVAGESLASRLLRGPTRKQDLWVLGEDGAENPYLQTEFSEWDGRLSPDERWMVYASDEAGPSAIYLRSFPDANGGKWRVSGIGAAFAPRWRADGKEIFYVGDGGQFMAVAVQPDGQAPVLSPPKPLFQPTSLTRSNYAVSRDGSRILWPVRGTVSTADTPLSVVLHWPTLFSRR